MKTINNTNIPQFFTTIVNPETNLEMVCYTIAPDAIKAFIRPTNRTKEGRIAITFTVVNSDTKGFKLTGSQFFNTLVSIFDKVDNDDDDALVRETFLNLFAKVLEEDPGYFPVVKVNSVSFSYEKDGFITSGN